MKSNCVLAALVTAELSLFSSTGLAQLGTATANPATGMAVNRSAPTSTATITGLTTVPVDFVKLRLAPGFMVSLNVLDDPDFVGTFRVDESGDLIIPILGAIHVAGETTSEAQLAIRNKLLGDGILRDPQVNLAVLQYTAPEVTIVGEVMSPGKYPLLAQRNLVDVLALAGGTTTAAGSEVRITRGSGNVETRLVHYARTTNPQAVAYAVVHPGDTVQVDRAGIVYVLGAVARPGGYVMQEEGTLNVLQAITLAFGTSLSASTSNIYLLRRDASGSVVETIIPYNKIVHGRSPDLELHAADVLYVPTSKLKAAFTSSQAVLAAAASASIFAAY